MRGPFLILLAIIAIGFFLHFATLGDSGVAHLAASACLVLAVIFSLSTSHLPGDADGQTED